MRVKIEVNKILTGILVLIVAGVYYYISLPAINIHSKGFCIFLIVLASLGVFLYYHKSKKDPKKHREGLYVIAALVILYIVGNILSSPIINAKKYRNLIQLDTRDFADDIKQMSLKQVPMLDKDSAEKLGERKMGSLVDMVSQFEVGNFYTQINFNEKPMRVTPIKYASFIKWFTNSKNGIPAYLKIDMTTQEVENVKLEEGMKYTPYDYFGRNLERHLRFKYPTYIFDKFKFEIDDAGTPFWIAPVKKFTIGLFGGTKISKVVLVNAITGDTVEYAIENVPQWVDTAYSSSLLLEYFNYYGMLKNGYLNSIFGQKDCVKTTDGYNYIAKDDDVWVYSGVSSITGDQSNIGFVLMNQRTAEARYYQVEGATEISAMGSAEGQVQNLQYKSTFPLLLNIANHPTYFMALKDAAGLVKKYAMVNVQQYNMVATGNTVEECEKEYVTQLKGLGISVSSDSTFVKKKEGVIQKIAPVVMEGNSHYYILFEGDTAIYDIPVSDIVSIVSYKEGDKINIEYLEEKDKNTVLSIN